MHITTSLKSNEDVKPPKPTTAPAPSANATGTTPTNDSNKAKPAALRDKRKAPTHSYPLPRAERFPFFAFSTGYLWCAARTHSPTLTPRLILLTSLPRPRKPLRIRQRRRRQGFFDREVARPPATPSRRFLDIRHRRRMLTATTFTLQRFFRRRRNTRRFHITNPHIINITERILILRHKLRMRPNKHIPAIDLPARRRVIRTRPKKIRRRRIIRRTQQPHTTIHNPTTPNTIRLPLIHIKRTVLRLRHKPRRRIKKHHPTIIRNPRGGPATAHAKLSARTPHSPPHPPHPDHTTHTQPLFPPAFAAAAS